MIIQELRTNTGALVSQVQITEHPEISFKDKHWNAQELKYKHWNTQEFVKDKYWSSQELSTTGELISSISPLSIVVYFDE